MREKCCIESYSARKTEDKERYTTPKRKSRNQTKLWFAARGEVVNDEGWGDVARGEYRR